MVARVLAPSRLRKRWRIARAVVVGVWALLAWLSPRRAPADGVVSIWYRSSDGCPDGSDFAAKVAARGKTAKIAKAGDRVDFVVTLGSEASNSHGRLERQTSDGIVAIREVDGTSCAEVADALAFTLALSDSTTKTDASGTPNSPAATPLPEPLESMEPSRAAEVEPASAKLPLLAAPPASPVSSPVAFVGAPPVEPMSLGVFALGRTALAPRGVLGGVVGLEGGGVQEVGWQFYLGAAAGRRTMARRHLSVQLYSGRVALCPLNLGSGAVRLAWCGAVEVGLLGANGSGVGGTQDSGFWSALGLVESLRWAPSPAWALGLDISALAPLTRYKIAAERPPAHLHTVSAVDWSVAVGVLFPIN